MARRSSPLSLRRSRMRSFMQRRRSALARCRRVRMRLRLLLQHVVPTDVDHPAAHVATLASSTRPTAGLTLFMRIDYPN